MPRKLVLWFALLIAEFLTGFILQYARVQRVQQELSASTKQLGSSQSSEQLSQLRDTATMMYLVDMGVGFSKGDEIALTGSKIKQGEADLVLAREVVRRMRTICPIEPFVRKRQSSGHLGSRV